MDSHISIIDKKIDNLKNIIELHLHLDGAISIDSCKKLAKIQNIKIPDNDNEIANEMMVSKNCKDLNEFLKKFDFSLSLLQTEIGIKNAIINLNNELFNQGVIYVEIRFAPQLSTNKGLSQEQVVLAALEGLKQSKINSNLILCCMRGSNNYQENIETIKIAKKYLNKGVCAIDLAGAEGLYKTRDFENIFKYANELEIPFTIHAGEADGLESIKDAINFGAKRIGHGVRAIENVELIKLIAKKDITLEICPSSNICTSIYKEIKDIPIKEFLDNGINITINTDDPTVCNTNIKNELKIIAKAFNLSYEDILKMQINAINASFASKKIKDKIVKKIIYN